MRNKPGNWQNKRGFISCGDVAIATIFSRNCGRPWPVLATMGITGTPSNSASLKEWIDWPFVSATSTMFNARMVG